MNNNEIKKLWIITFVLIFVIPVGFFYYNLYIPVGDNTTEKIIEIYPGMSLKKIATLLKEEGFIRNALVFEIFTKLMHAERRLKTGKYLFSGDMTMIEIFEQLYENKSSLCSFTIPEGYTIDDIATLLSNKRLVDKQKFIALTQDTLFIKDRLNLTADNLEGYLYPDTYFIYPGVSEQTIIELLVSQCKKVLFTDENRAQAATLGLSMYKVLILASIIQKETSYPDEMPVVSAVFHNRLKIGMALQSDPTVIYGMGDSFDGNLRKKDLPIDSPYNTYIYRGLPPTPISNPSASAIHAALYPADVGYLYFVSMNNGRHAFSATLSKHTYNVSKYQIEKSKR